jgi:hypothetical protein
MILSRVSYTTYGTFGVLLGEEEIPIAVTLENPWIQNLRMVSCIPIGLYQCGRVLSPKFGDTFEVLDVHERDDILFHKGNIETDTSGCILLGTSFGYLGLTPAILQSNPAYRHFMALLKEEDSFELAIVDAKG